MAETTRDIKRRIKSIGSTRKITKAMELVSSAKLKRVRKKLEDSRPYYETVLNNIQDILSTNINYPLLNKREVKSSLYIIFSSDKGLVGGYNGNIIRLVEGEKTNKDIKLITLGNKATDYFRRRKYNIIENFTGISEDPSFDSAKTIGELGFNLYKNEEIDEINLVYTKFLGTIRHEPRVLKLLPIEINKKENKNKTIMEFEPSTEEVLDFLIPKYINSSIYGALIEASSSEQAARRMAMEAATDNANDLIEELETSFNRARQLAITNEITEIISASNVL